MYLRAPIVLYIHEYRGEGSVAQVRHPRVTIKIILLLIIITYGTLVIVVQYRYNLLPMKFFSPYRMENKK
jgi:hypothetical protein